ncbi:MAG: hypothetical protein HXX18_09285 [Bacteroidetes bacterium]|nr:hypothetical protein [Bacteroidota bacterium]
MKALLYILGTLLIISLPLAWLFFNSHALSIDTVIINDHTDYFTVKPKADEIKNLYDFKNNIWDEANFRLINITDININKTYQAKIESENYLLSNKFKRKEKIKAFLTDIDKITVNSEKEKIGKDYSAIYEPIAKELNRLSQHKADKKYMLIYGDLMQNTDEISFYDKNVFEKLKSNPDKIKQYFNSQVSLNNLGGIKIILLFQPNNIKQDVEYKVVSEFYKKLFEEKGAKVEITANLN